MKKIFIFISLTAGVALVNTSVLAAEGDSRLGQNDLRSLASYLDHVKDTVEGRVQDGLQQGGRHLADFCDRHPNSCKHFPLSWE